MEQAAAEDLPQVLVRMEVGEQAHSLAHHLAQTARLMQEETEQDRMGAQVESTRREGAVSMGGWRRRRIIIDWDRG